MFSAKDTLAKVDPELWKAIESENHRQEEHIELIASENYVSKAVMEAQEDLRPLGERPHRPILLGEAQARLGEDDVRRCRARQGADERVVEGRTDLDRLVIPRPCGRGHDVAGERRQAVENRRPAPGGGNRVGGVLEMR